MATDVRLKEALPEITEAIVATYAECTRTTHLGASYEAAWIACVLLADRSGERRLTRFYTGLGQGDDVAAEFRSAFGLSLAAFTREWRRALTDLAA